MVFLEEPQLLSRLETIVLGVEVTIVCGAGQQKDSAFKLRRKYPTDHISLKEYSTLVSDPISYQKTLDTDANK